MCAIECRAVPPRDFLKNAGTIVLLMVLTSSCGSQKEPANAPLSDFRQEITAPAPPQKISIGQSFLLSGVTVKNTGQQTWRAEGSNPIELTYNWLTPDRALAEHGVVTPIPADVAPGQSMSVVAKIRTPDKPGDYIISFTMIAENIAWFSDRGSRVLEYPVTVVPQ